MRGSSLRRSLLKRALNELLTKTQAYPPFPTEGYPPYNIPYGMGITPMAFHQIPGQPGLPIQTQIPQQAATMYPQNVMPFPNQTQVKNE